MAMGPFLAAVMIAGQLGATQAVDVAYNDLAAGNDAAAIERIEANATLDNADPARLINLGVAHARQGDSVTARKLFLAAIASQDRYQLETGSGSWVDSRNLAREALAALDRGEFSESRYARAN